MSEIRNLKWGGIIRCLGLNWVKYPMDHKSPEPYQQTMQSILSHTHNSLPKKTRIKIANPFRIADSTDIIVQINGRAIQHPALEIWHGQEENEKAAQQALLYRAKCNRAARSGEYRENRK